MASMAGESGVISVGDGVLRDGDDGDGDGVRGPANGDR